jgi:hypothetical protein
MAKLEIMARPYLIIEVLRRGSYSFKDLYARVQSDFEFRGYNLNMSIKTFQREVKEILSLYNIQIKYNRSTNQYFIEGEIDEAKERIFELQKTADVLKLSEGLAQYVSFEKKDFRGNFHFVDLLHAIKHRLIITFEHQKYGEGITRKTVQPLALKESKSRWYLIAKDNSNEHIVTFGLDRISELEVTDRQFNYPKDYNVDEVFKYSFGIMTNENQQPEEVILSYTPYQGNFIKSLKLHPGQETIIDNEQELRIKLLIHITHDFKMEILSHGDTVKVIQPESLIEDLKLTYQNVLKQY